MLHATRRRSIGATLTAFSVIVLTGCDDPVVVQDNYAARHVYEQQAERWTRWALELPHSESPIADETGERCDDGQSGKVWYLAGTFGGPVERSCTISHKKHVFFPLVNLWGINPDTSIDDDAAQQEFIDFFTEYFPERRAATCALTLRLDGVDLLGDDLAELDELLYVEILEPFEIDINADNYASEFGFAGGPTPVLTHGHFALLRPLDPGEHVLEFGGAICDGEAIEFETSAVYNLTVD